MCLVATTTTLGVGGQVTVKTNGWLNNGQTSWVISKNCTLCFCVDFGVCVCVRGAPPNPSQSLRDGSGPCDKCAYLLGTHTSHMQSHVKGCRRVQHSNTCTSAHFSLMLAYFPPSASLCMFPKGETHWHSPLELMSPCSDKPRGTGSV